MTLKLVFNPLSSEFDYIDVVDTSSFAPAVPTVMVTDEVFQIPDRRQALFAYPIIGAPGSMILQGEDSILVGVD